MSRIEGKVAKVLNERELVLNVGTTQGVEVGMRFKVLYSGGIEITDPDSGKLLGSVERPKTEVKIVSAQDNLSVGRTFRTITIPAVGSIAPRGLSASFEAMLNGPYEPEKRVVETLRASDGFADKEINAAESSVQVGDPVVQIVPLPKKAKNADEEEGY